MELTTDFVIIGAGAAGLFAAVSAARSGLRPLLIERRHRSGLKLLISGNNRCNFSRNLPIEEFIAAYGNPQSDFLRPALTALPPPRLREFFQSIGLASTLSGDRIYPESGKADDVLHALLDTLRDYEIPLMYNSAVEHIRRDEPTNQWLLTTRSLTIRCAKLLITVGGFSFPKTGSIGDGLRFSRELGLAFTPVQPGLVASELPRSSPLENIADDQPLEFPDVILSTDGASARGNLIIDRGLLRGSAIYDLNRTIAHSAMTATNTYPLFCDFFPQTPEKSLSEKLTKFIGRASTMPQLLNALGLSIHAAQAVASLLTKAPTASALKHLPMGKVTRRALKEAITTAGGFSLEEFDAETMQAKRFPGLYAAGEVLDYDGPTGGFNLHAAFATAAAAVAAISGRALAMRPTTAANHDNQRIQSTEQRHAHSERHSDHTQKNPKSAWGRDFWKNNKLSR